MAERFKTGYLADQVSYTALGQAYGQQISSSIEKIAAQRKQRQLELDSRMGFTKAQGEALPAGLSGRYLRGAQAALNNMQERAAKAYATGNAEDVQAYQQAKVEYNDIKNMGVSVSSREREIVDNISIGAFPNLAGTVSEALDEYQQHDGGTFEYKGGQLMYIDSDGSEKPWRESRINDPRGGFLPQLKWEGSDFMVTPLSDDIYTANLANRAGLYQEKFEGTDFQTGNLLNEDFYNDVQRILDKRLKANPNEMSEAMSIYGYKVNEAPNKTELSQKDITDASTIYPAEAFVGNKRFLAGKLNNNGEFEFDAAMDELPERMPDEFYEDIQNVRDAKKAYYEAVAGDLKERVALDNEAGKYMAALDEEAAELAEAQMELAADDAELLNQAPSLMWDGTNQYTMVHSSDTRYRTRLNGKPLAVDETYFEFVENANGEMVPIEIGFKVSSTMSRQEMIDQLLNAGEDQEQAQATVDNWFKKYDNTVISRMREGDNGMALDPDFMRILTGLNNGVVKSGEKPASQLHRALAKEKMMLHRDGSLVEGSLSSNGIQRVEPEEPAPSAATPAPTPSAGTSAPSASAPAATPAPAAAPTPTPDPAATPAPEPTASEVSGLDETPDTPTVEFDNLTMQAGSILTALGASRIENVVTRLDFNESDEDSIRKVQNGMIPVFLQYEAEAEGLPDGYLNDGMRYMRSYVSLEELKGMTPEDFQNWKANEIKEDQRYLEGARRARQRAQNRAQTPEQPAPEQPSEAAPTATAVSGDETDVANIEVPVASEPARQEAREEEEETTRVVYNAFYNALDELADFNEDGAEQVQDYYEGLDENQARAFMRMVMNNYKKTPPQFPSLIDGTLKFVAKPDSAD